MKHSDHTEHTDHTTNNTDTLVTEAHHKSSKTNTLERNVSRRSILLSAGAAFAVAGLTGCTAPVRYGYPQSVSNRGITLPETPQCYGKEEATIANGEGPFYTRTTPMKESFLEDGMPGTKLVLVGRLLTTDCQPIVGAVLDFWQSDEDGVYDNAGYNLRGHQFSDENGMYQLTTIKPASYTGMYGLIKRAPHIHAKVQGRDTKLLTTQLYFPDERTNDSDFLYREDLQLKVRTLPDGSLSAVFDFVLSGTA